MTFILKYAILYTDKNWYKKLVLKKEIKVENRKVKTPTDRLFYSFLLLLLFAGFFATVSYISKRAFKASEVPTVYMVYGVQDICRDAIDAQGNPITCEEAMKDGRYNRIRVSHETLNKK